MVRDAVYDSLRDAIPPTMYQCTRAEREAGPERHDRGARRGRIAGAPHARPRRRARPGRRRRHADVQAVPGHGARGDRPGAGDRDAVGLLRRARAAAGGDRSLRRDVVRGQPPPHRDRHPHGARRRSRQRGQARPRRESALLVGLGVAAGAGIALWASRFVSTLLFGLQPRDPATLLTAALVLSAIGAMAGYLPARRAARIDPAARPARRIAPAGAPGACIRLRRLGRARTFLHWSMFLAASRPGWHRWRRRRRPMTRSPIADRGRSRRSSNSAARGSRSTIRSSAPASGASPIA